MRRLKLRSTSLTTLISTAALLSVVSANLSAAPFCNRSNMGYGYAPGYGYQPGHSAMMQPMYGYGYGMPRGPMMAPQPGTAYPRHQAYTQPQQQVATAAPTKTSEADTSSAQVTISGMQFQPATIRIKSGEKVTWKNMAPMPHTIKGSNASDLSSGTLGRGSSFEKTFDKPGSYDYYCSLHPSMKGKIIVE
jgi:plastocyanin